MNITFILGNGLDMTFGLNTSYTNFYQYYNKLNKTGRMAESISADLNTWADMEEKLGKITKDYSSEESQIYLSDKADLEKELAKYLKKQEQRVVLKKGIGQEFNQHMAHFTDELHKKEAIQKIISKCNDTIHYQFITLNYTNVLDRIVEEAIKEKPSFTFHQYGALYEFDKLERPLHLHGTLAEAMITGVDNKAQIENEELAADKDFARLMIKRQLNREIWQHNPAQQAAKILSDSEIICTYGTSFGATDQCWWESIGKWLLQKSSHYLILYYHTEDQLNPSAQEFLRITSLGRNQFLEKCSLTLEQKKKVERQIIVVPNSKLFQLEEMIVFP